MAPSLLAMDSLLDRYFLEEHHVPPIWIIGLAIIVQTIGGAVLALFNGLDVTLSAPEWMLCLIAGASFVGMAFGMIYAAEREEISRTVPLFFIYVPFVGTFSHLLFGEPLNGTVALGFFLIAGGAILLATKERFELSPALLPILGAAGAFTIYSLALKSLTSSLDLPSGFFLTRMAALAVFLPWGAKLMARTQRTTESFPMLPVMANECLAVLAFIFHMWAVTQGPVSVVNAAYAFRPLFVYLWLFLSYLFTKENIFHEIHTSWKDYLGKGLGTTLAVVGFSLVNP